MPPTASTTATNRAATPSARVQPVARMTAPAIAVAMKAMRSVSMCLKLPPIFIDSRLAFESCQVAARFTTMPTRATIRIAFPPAAGGVTKR